jgi:D-serine deaminase-like pyridoxal phosphate-dependent protein
MPAPASATRSGVDREARAVAISVSEAEEPVWVVLGCVVGRFSAAPPGKSTRADVRSPLGLGAVRSLRVSAEHAAIELAEAAAGPRVGDRVEFVATGEDPVAGSAAGRPDRQ